MIGELEDLCSSVPGVRLVENGYDKSNWYVVLQKYDIELPMGKSCKVPTVSDRIPPGITSKM